MATIGAVTMTSDRSYTQLSESTAAAAAAGPYLGCNGTSSGSGGGGGLIPRDASMSTQVVVLSPATPTETTAEDKEGMEQFHYVGYSLTSGKS